MKNIVSAAVIATFLLVHATFAFTAEITVYSTIGVQGALEELTPKFEKASGHKLAITWGTASMIVKRIQSGETADVLILSLAGIETMVKEGRLVKGSEVTLASSAVAIGIKGGSPKPDISTPEALRQTLLNAKSISYTDPAAGGASGVYFAQLLERMGIADAMKTKTKYPPPGGYCADFLLTGDAELAIQQKPEIMHVAGTEVVGPLPGNLNMVTVFAAGMGVNNKNAEAAKALITFLTTPTATLIYKAKGLEPFVP
jgi:molybdate transport system substrate-binding protein